MPTAPRTTPCFRSSWSTTAWIVSFGAAVAAVLCVQERRLPPGRSLYRVAKILQIRMGSRQTRRPNPQRMARTPAARRDKRPTQRSNVVAEAAAMGEDWLEAIQSLQAKGMVPAEGAVRAVAPPWRVVHSSDREEARVVSVAEVVQAAEVEPAGVAAPRSDLGGWPTRIWPARCCGSSPWRSSASWLPRSRRWSWPLGPDHQMLLLWLGWLATYTVVFSFAGGIFHDYYVVTMAAPMAALTGIGGAALWKSFHSVPRDSIAALRRGWAHYLSQGWRPLLLPLAILLTAGWQALIWLNYPELAKWTVPALLIGATAGGLGLLALRGSWWAPVLTIGLFACIGWLWSRDSAAPDILTVAAGELDKARVALRDTQGLDALKKLYTKFSPDIASVVPDLRRQAPLVTAPLLRGGAIACGCLLVIFLLAKWRPIVARGAAVAVAVCFLVLYVGPGVWALSPLWGTGGMLPAADASVFERAIRERQQRAREAEQRAERAARVAVQAMTVGSWAGLPVLAAAPVTFVGNDFAASARNRQGFPGGAAGLRGGRRMPGAMPAENESTRAEREKLVAFLKANDHGERWLLAVSGSRQASAFIIEDGLSVMPIGGFNGGSPTFGTEPEEIKARLTELVAEGQVRFFQIAGGRGGFGGGFGGGRGWLWAACRSRWRSPGWRTAWWAGPGQRRRQPVDLHAG